MNDLLKNTVLELESTAATNLKNAKYKAAAYILTAANFIKERVADDKVSA